MTDGIISNRNPKEEPSEVMLYELLGVIAFGVFLASAILQIFPQLASLLTVIGGSMTVLAAKKGIRMDNGAADDE